jgi:hypothetical protein
VTPLSKQIRLGAIAALAVLLLGVAVAIGQPGNLGDDGDDSAAPATTTTEATVAETTTSTTVAPTTSTTTSVGTGSSGSGGATTTTTPGSGLGATGSGSAGRRNLANTGGEDLLLPAMGLFAVAYATRRLSHR